MKKLIAMLLAALLVLVNVAALAAEVEPDMPETPNVAPVLRQQGGAGAGTPHFIKTYETNKTGVVPTEDLTFTVTANNANPDGTLITVGTENEVNVSSGSTTVNVNVPTPTAEAFTKPGKYTYTVTEVAGSSQGTATYDTKDITVDVYVVYTNGALTVLGTNVYTAITGTGETAAKEDEIKNVYEVGDLEVGKTTSGNLANPAMEFTFEVVFTAETEKTVNSDITVSGNGKAKAHESDTEVLTTIGKGWSGTKTIYVVVTSGQKVKFENIPAGVSYTVTETKAGTENITNIDRDATTQLENANDANAYTVTTTYSDDADKKIAKGDSDTVTIDNYKGIEIPTGIALDTLPYVLILAVAAFGLVAVTARKRREY